MDHNLHLYNTLTRKKEKFTPLNPPFVGMYVCGPTVYSDVHLGNCRTFISFDLMYRYLVHLGYKVRYVRNITDAGHLEGDRDEGDDKFAKKAKLLQVEPMEIVQKYTVGFRIFFYIKINSTVNFVGKFIFNDFFCNFLLLDDKFAKKAKLLQVEPMEIVQKYTVGFREVMGLFNTLPPSIEPTATGHIIEQQEIAKKIIENKFAYEINGTVYFDVEKYSKTNNYGELTNRKLDDLLENTRELDGQDEKKGRLDFALWIKAKPEHLMQWPSPWGMGFPGWHIECSAMSTKYLGERFDIHGGGMDLQATHHTNEIAQNIAYCGKSPATYWMHTNMLTVNGARMSKSSGNSFLPMELLTGAHPLLSKGYNPMAVKFFMMQTHYSSTLDFSDTALQGSEKAFNRLMESYKTLQTLSASPTSNENISTLEKKCYEAMDDDFNTPILIANLFEAATIINSANDKRITLTQIDIDSLKRLFQHFVFDVMGLKSEEESGKSNQALDKVMQLVLDLRAKVKANKDFATSDEIRNKLTEAGIQVKDSKDGATWSI